VVACVQLVNGYSSETAIISVPPPPLDDERQQPAAASADRAPADRDGSAERRDDNDSVTDTEPTTTD